MADTHGDAGTWSTGYTPTEEERRSLAEWFTRYDALAARGDAEAMADMAVFPLNTVTDDGAGTGSAAQSDRAEFIASTRESFGQAGGEVAFDSTRTPFFLSGALAVVFTRSTTTVGDVSTELYYADVLIRSAGEWRFQTMVQGGWGAPAQS
ncbi:nuclear transport factor 2 family protein [Nocardiopsis sediminis]|uniref:Nuclear transport factor 2 family protein n=1 Tax=Nocardiopsis sediminis TaxID=1778267 RepID=A0ABV8FQL0_9ACTN